MRDKEMCCTDLANRNKILLRLTLSEHGASGTGERTTPQVTGSNLVNTTDEQSLNTCYVNMESRQGEYLARIVRITKRRGNIGDAFQTQFVLLVVTKLSGRIQSMQRWRTNDLLIEGL
jgi:hypothetical protein